MYIERFDHHYRDAWNNYLEHTKNYHFFFHRDYMEYHKDRFDDFSLMVFNEKRKVIALLPANKQGNTLYSHQGLTFGGFLVDEKMKAETMLAVFDSLIIYLKGQKIERLIYKCIPHIYHSKPSEEDKYALFRNDAKLLRRDLTSTIDLTKKVKYSKGRKWTLNKAERENIEVYESENHKEFWFILTETLKSRHGIKPTHTLEEMQMLRTLFPKNIRLFLAKKNNQLLSGTLIYENPELVHTQYLLNTKLGKTIGALDFLIDKLIQETYRHKKFFDFGISNESSGKYLNKGLIAQKEGFGAMAIAQDVYELEIK